MNTPLNQEKNQGSTHIYGMKNIASMNVTGWLDIEPPPPDWLVDELIHERTISMLDGIGSVGKSYIAMQLAVAISSGEKWLDKWNCKKGKVLVINAEDPEPECHRRFRRIAENYDKETIRDAAKNIYYISISNLPPEVMPNLVLMDTKFQPQQFFHYVAAIVKEIKPAAVIFDPLGSFVAVENDNAYAAQIYALLQRLNTTIVVVHHNSKIAMSKKDAGIEDRAKSRGASNWVEKTKTRLYLRKLFMKIDKCNYNHELQDKILQLEFKNGMFVAKSQFLTTNEEEEQIEEEIGKEKTTVGIPLTRLPKNYKTKKGGKK